MLQGLKQNWRELKHGEPGKRFTAHYQRRHQSGSSPLRKALFIGAGAVIVAAGIFFLPAPGPGFVIIFLGGGLIAQESKAAARVLDWCELKLRTVADRALGVWQRASMPTRAAIAVAGLVIAGGAGYLAYQIFLGK